MGTILKTEATARASAAAKPLIRGTSMQKIAGAALAAALLAGSAAAAAAADIPGNNTTQASLPLRSTPTQGAYEKAGDRDWYRVTLEKGKDYALELTAVPNDPDNVDYIATIAVRQADGKLLAQASDNFFPSTDGLSFRPEVSGTYFVDVGQDPGATFVGKYSIRLDNDCRADSLTRCDLALGETRKSSITYVNDFDYLAVKLDKSKSYMFTVNGNSVGAYVADGSGNQLTYSASSSDGPSSIRNFKPPFSGTFYFLIANNDDFPSPYSAALAYETDRSQPPSLGTQTRP